MARKRKRRGDAAATEAGVEVAEREAPGAAAKSATTGKTERRRGGDVTAEQEESTAVHAPGPADSGKETTDREGRKPKLNKKKRNKADQSPCVPASEVAAAATGKFGDDCTDGVGVLGDPEVNINPRNGDDTDHPEVNIREKGTLERKKPNHRKRKKKNMQQRSPSVVSDDKAVEVDKSRTDCKDVPGDDRTIWSPKNEENPCFSSVKIAEQEIQALGDADGVGVLGNREVSMNPRNGDDPDHPEVNIEEKGTPERKKLKRRKRKRKKMQQISPAVSDDNAVEVDKSRTDCKDVPGDDRTIWSPKNEENLCFSSVKIAEQEIQALGDADGVGVLGNTEVSMNPRNGDDPDHPEVNIGEKGTPERKKLKRRKRKSQKMQQISPAVSDDNVVEDEKSRTDCKDVEAVPGDDETIRNPRKQEDSGFFSVKVAEQEIPERKKPRKGKNDKQGQSPSAVTDDNTVVVGTSSGNERTHGKGVPGLADVSMNSRNGEDQDCAEVNIAEKETLERKKPKLKKSKENKQEQSPVAVSYDGAVQSHKSGNGCIEGDDASGDAQVCTSTRNVEDPYCSEVNIAEKGRKKPKLQKQKNKKEGSSSVVLDAGAVVADESGNGCTDGDCAPQDIEASIYPRNGEDPDCPVVDNAEKGMPEMCKPKRKKRKNNQEQSPSAVLDAGDVVVHKSGHGSTNVGAPSGGADVTMSPRIGEGPEYPNVNATDDLLDRNKVNKVYSQISKIKKQMKNKHAQSSCAVPATCAVLEDKSGRSYIDGKGSLGDTEISTSPRNGKDHDCPEVNITNGLVEGKNGNNDHSQKPKNKKRKRTKKAQGAVTEIPPVADVSSDERKDVCSTGYMKVPDKSDIIFTTSTSGESHKENVRDIYSPEGSLVRFQRKKLLILDLNGILADINTDRDIARVADGRVRGKNVFKRPYIDDFLRFCFQNFELGIWSSRMKVNVDAVVDILMRDLRRHLVFCWDMSKCTTTQAATLENNRKPLVLKELKKLWNKEDPDLPWEQGEFSPSNTLLVDDSPYKALRNPPYTAIFPQSYSYHIKEDESLGPGGDLRVYLENIAAADDVQHYVQEHPFGQPSITESDPNWNFYAKIHYRLDRRKWS